MLKYLHDYGLSKGILPSELGRGVVLDVKA
jgi:hypothetical protein